MLSNDNAYDVLAALGIEDSYSSSPWPIARFRSLRAVARRNLLGHRSPAIPTTEHSEAGRMSVIECARPEGYVEQRLKDFPIWSIADLRPAQHMSAGDEARVRPAVLGSLPAPRRGDSIFLALIRA